MNCEYCGDVIGPKVPAGHVYCWGTVCRRSSLGASPDDCEACDGTGWTDEGWKRAQASGAGFDPFKGDCPACGGTGLKETS